MLVCLCPLWAQDVPADPNEVARQAAQVRIGAIDTRVNKLTDKLDALSGSSQKLSDEVGRLELQRALINSKIEKHELQLEEASRQLEENKAKRVSLEKDAEVQRKRIGGRLRQLYKRGKLGHSQILLKQSQLSELINAYHYAKVLTRRDSDALHAYVATIEGLEVVNQELIRIRQEAEATRASLNNEQKELKKVLKQRERRLAAIRKEAGQNLQLLEELELEKDEMLMMVRRIIETDADPMDLQVPITRYKGRLSWPAKGRIMKRFGVYRDPEFKTKQRQNGVNIGASYGSPVKVVYSGRVMYADWFKSYGNVVIVDHGSKVITFYAHLQEIQVQRGDFLERDTPIGLSGDTGSLEGPMLHFEVREKTEPVNPTKWLKKRR